MSRIGKMPIPIVEGMQVSVAPGLVTLTNPKGSASFKVPSGILVRVDDGKIVVSQEESTAGQTKALFGLTRAMIANIQQGLDKGFEKKLELSGVGYRASVSGNALVLSVGFSHPVKIDAPAGITFSVAESIISVKGTDKELVGNTAARIRMVRPPEPYKGKGIKYVGERIRRKAGKAAKAVGGK